MVRLKHLRGYVVIRKFLYSIFNTLAVFIRRWKHSNVLAQVAYASVAFI
jgi:hypothetical protein